MLFVSVRLPYGHIYRTQFKCGFNPFTYENIYATMGLRGGLRATPVNWNYTKLPGAFKTQRGPLLTSFQTSVFCLTSSVSAINIQGLSSYSMTPVCETLNSLPFLVVAVFSCFSLAEGWRCGKIKHFVLRLFWSSTAAENWKTRELAWKITDM